MKKTVLILAAALLWVVPAGADEVVRSFRQQISVAGADAVRLEFAVGEVEVEAWDRPQVELSVKVTCDKKTARCVDAAKSLHLVYGISGDQLRVRFKDWPKWGGTKGLGVEAHINVPRNLALKTDLGVGELTIKGVEGSVTADLGVGEVDITLPKEAFRSATLDTGIGETSLSVAGRHYESAGLMTRTIHWKDGKGRAALSVDCGVGEINVEME